MLGQAKSSISAKTLTNAVPLELLEEEVELLVEVEELDEDEPPHWLLLQDQKPVGVL